MNRKATILTFLVSLAICITSQAQDQTLFGAMMATSGQEVTGIHKEKLAAFINKIEGKKASSEQYFLKVLFKKTHQQFLKNYQPYSEFKHLFTDGDYDCLTATSLFAILLDKLDFEYSIFETNYHIFVIVNSDEGEVLFESTDPINGFETNPKQIESRINGYVNDAKAVGNENYHFQAQLFQEVNPSQLSGLLLFNQAVKAFNNKDLIKATQHLKEANGIYENARNKELAGLIILAVEGSDLERKVKAEIQANLFAMVANTTVASR